MAATSSRAGRDGDGGADHDARRCGELVGVDLSAEFSVGDHTPPMDAVDEPLPIDDSHVRTLGAWWAFGVEVIDEAIAGSPATDAPRLQLWPEHFDVAGTVTVNGQKINLGASPGDAFEPTPYLYVGPWSADRPGDAALLERPVRCAAAGCRSARRRTRGPRRSSFLRDGLRRFCADLLRTAGR